ncbi:hypothetical protein MPER_12141 [Moniliophthora perniciosa FA553]|nr:hypothetical protein MPER_12141 [Moniliophthora perniciosa FA553]
MSLITTLKLMNADYLMHNAELLTMHGTTGDIIAQKASLIPLFWRLFKKSILQEHLLNILQVIFIMATGYKNYTPSVMPIETDIKHHLNYWCWNFSVCSEVSSAVASQVLEAAAFKLSCIFLGPQRNFKDIGDNIFKELSISQKTLTKMSDFLCQGQFQLASIGTSYASGYIYHLQILMAIRKLLGILIWNFGKWDLYDFGYVIYVWFNILGPCPEFLYPLPQMLASIKDKYQQNALLKWLQSFPSEYGSQTAPLIEQLAMECKNLPRQ